MHERLPASPVSASMTPPHKSAGIVTQEREGGRERVKEWQSEVRRDADTYMYVCMHNHKLHTKSKL